MLTVALGAGAVGGAIPASAQAKTITLNLLNGIKIALPLPDGTPLAQMQLPPLSSPVLSISVDPSPTPGSVAGSLALPGAPGVGAPTTLAAGPTQTPVPSVAAQKAQKATGRKKAIDTAAGTSAGSLLNSAPTALPVGTAFRAPDGLPLPANPTLSLAAIGPVPVGVPDFFIEKFTMPPFLIPIFQAAGVEDNVPWQVLGAMNEVETDYGRNLTPSSAGAIGWMQILPATWQQFAVDANSDGIKDPYNPVDAIFTAARFLNAAGASHDLRGAILAYNPQQWYADSVLLRAKLLGGLPSDLVTSITGLTNGLFPVNAAARYADDTVETAAIASLARSQNIKAPVTASAKNTTTNIYAKAGSRVVAVQDGVIAAMGFSPILGNYIRLRDSSGNIYTYSQLKKLAALNAVPKPARGVAVAATATAAAPADPAPTSPATAGHQVAVPQASPGGVSTVTQAPTARVATDTPAGPVRLLAHPYRHGQQVKGNGAGDLSAYLTVTSGLTRSSVDLQPMTVGSRVIAGAILGEIGVTHAYQAPHVGFQIKTPGKRGPLIDAKPILDGWKLLQATSLYRSKNLDALIGTNPTIGQILLESKDQLQQQVLADPAIDIYPCGRADIQSGSIDQRVLATLEFLSASGFKPTVSALRCGTSMAKTVFDKSGALSANAAGTGVEISKVNGIPVLGNQGQGSITDLMIRRMLTLQGGFKPSEIVSLMTYGSADNTLGASDHADRVSIEFAPLFNPFSKTGQQVTALLKPRQWITLISRLGQIANPSVATQPSSASIPVTAGH